MAASSSSSSSSSAQWSKTMRDNRLKELRKQHLESVRGDFGRIREHNTRMGESVCLQERYIPLLMRKEYHKIKDKEHKIVSKGRNHVRVMEANSYFGRPKTTLHTLFDPEDNGFTPKVVVLHGPAGIGKTWTSRKIMLDWASGDLYQDKFDFVFYLSCRELNTFAGKISLVRLLSRSSSLSSGDLVFILKDSGNHDRLLFVIDGFDEFEWTLEEGVEVCHDFSEETHKETLLRNLFRKEVAKESSLFITTRSMAQEKLSTFIVDSRYFEIEGFSEEDCWRYFLKSFIVEADAEKAFSVIKGNNLLFTMCSVPILCWIVCTLLRQEMKKGLDFLQYKTTTSIYLLYLQGLIIHHGRKQPVLPCLRKLCALANEGVLNQKILFEEEDLERHGLSVSEVESVFLNENIFHVSIKSGTCYSFIHLSVQEFLAALHYVLDDGDEGEMRGEASLPEICKRGSLPKLCDDHPHLSLAVRFLFGLLYEKQLHEFAKSTGCKISLRVRSAVEEWVTGDTATSELGEWITMGISSGPFIDAISCLYETQDEDLIRRALPRPKCLNLDGMYHHAKWNKNDETQLYYCLKLAECPMTVSMQWKKIYSEEREMLFPLLHRCQKLCFTQCHFLQRRKRKPTNAFLADDDEEEEEELSSSDEDDDVMEGEPAGLSWLINPESQVQELGFHECPFSPLCYEVLRSALVTNRSLTKLDLSRNRLEDSGMKRLCEGLRDPRCPLQDLSLFNCHLSPLCCNILCSAVVKNRSLIKLNLTWNPIEDSGMKHLCEWLRDPCCILEELSVQGCHLSPLCCDDLRSALLKNRRLTKLDISNNPLTDSGMKLVCEGISYPECTVQDLNIWQCGLTPSCCDDLYSVLVTNRSLTKLTLTKNHLEDSGVKRLCEALRDPRCVLQDLSAMQCRATVSCFEDLCSIIMTNPTLTSLETSLEKDDGKMSEAEVSRWCEELRRLGCSLEDWMAIHVTYNKGVTVSGRDDNGDINDSP